MIDLLVRETPTMRPDMPVVNASDRPKIAFEAALNPRDGGSLRIGGLFDATGSQCEVEANPTTDSTGAINGSTTQDRFGSRDIGEPQAAVVSRPSGPRFVPTVSICLVGVGSRFSIRSATSHTR